MRVALVITLGGDLVRSTEHLGVAYIAAVLRENGYAVDMYEISEKEIPYKEKYNGLLSGGYDLIGFTTTCITMENVNSLSKIVKENNPCSYILYGGHMATFLGVKLLKEIKEVDFSIIGEGEYTFLELVKCLEKKNDLSSVKGLIYRDKDKIIVNEGRELIRDLDSLPFPARDQFEQHGGKVQYIRLCTSRGCLGSCGFCSNFVGRKQKGETWRGRSPKNVVDEIESLMNKYNFITYDFVDSTFEDPGPKGKERIEKIAKEIIERKLNIYYNCCFRAENWTYNDEKLLRILVDSGLEKVNIGFESGNNRGLKILNKRATVEDNYRAISVLKKFPEIYLTFGFIMLHPYSTVEDLKENAEFLHNTGFGQVIRHYFWRLEIYPDTILEKRLINDNLLDKSYDINDGMYKYHYQNSEVSHFEYIFQEMLTLQSVWDFEIFDILIHTFIVRLQKKYRSEAIIDNIDKFSKYVTEARHEIADFNYVFFQRMLNTVEEYDIGKEKKCLDNYINEKMNAIKKEQYILGRELTREGYRLTIK